jgi:hypothetical protein
MEQQLFLLVAVGAGCIQLPQQTVEWAGKTPLLLLGEAVHIEPPPQQQQWQARVLVGVAVEALV